MVIQGIATLDESAATGESPIDLNLSNLIPRIYGQIIRTFMYGTAIADNYPNTLNSTNLDELRQDSSTSNLNINKHYLICLTCTPETEHILMHFGGSCAQKF